MLIFIPIVEFFKLDPNGMDGLEKINRFLFLLPIPIIFIGGPGSVIAVILNFAFFRLFNFENTSLIIIYTFIIAILAFVGLYAFVLMCYVIVIHCNSSSKWIYKFYETW